MEVKLVGEEIDASELCLGDVFKRGDYVYRLITDGRDGVSAVGSSIVATPVGKVTRLMSLPGWRSVDLPGVVDERPELRAKNQKLSKENVALGAKVRELEADLADLADATNELFRLCAEQPEPEEPRFKRGDKLRAARTGHIPDVGNMVEEDRFEVGEVIVTNSDDYYVVLGYVVDAYEVDDLLSVLNQDSSGPTATVKFTQAYEPNVGPVRIPIPTEGEQP